MEWYHMALIAAVAILLVALFVRTRSGQRDEKEPSQAAVPMQAGLEDQGEATQVSGAVIAAITAAIAAMEAPSQRLVVRTIRRADRPESIWAQAGRRDLMNR